MQVAATHRRSTAESSLRMDDMRREIEELQSANDVSRKTVSQRGNEHAEKQIDMLRADLRQTVSDWKEAERERQIKEDATKRLQTELMKERDKSQLLLSQINKLEERLMAANRELAAFRGLDVYHAAKEAELATYRTTRMLSERHSESIYQPGSATSDSRSPRIEYDRSLGNTSRVDSFDVDLDRRPPSPPPLRSSRYEAPVEGRDEQSRGGSRIGKPLSIADISTGSPPHDNTDNTTGSSRKGIFFP